MATLTTAGVTFGDSTVQTTAYPGIPALDAIGSIQGFICSSGTSQLAGTTISGSYLFRPTAIGSGVTCWAAEGTGTNFGGALGVNTFGTIASLVNRTTAFTTSSSTNAVTYSPRSGTWRILNSFAKAVYIGGDLTTTAMPSVLVVRVS